MRNTRRAIAKTHGRTGYPAGDMRLAGSVELKKRFLQEIVGRRRVSRLRCQKDSQIACKKLIQTVESEQIASLIR